jgi:RES domain-containing protein
MPPTKPPRPSNLIDLLDAQERREFLGRVWRAVRAGYDVLRGASAGGRWDDGTFDVLYTSATKEGAIAERKFHLSQGLPVIPSRPKYVVHELDVKLSHILDLTDTSLLEALGLDMRRFGALSYVERSQEYPTTQQIAEITHFLEFDGMLVPSARSPCNNLIIFTERVKPGAISVINSEPMK